MRPELHHDVLRRPDHCILQPPDVISRLERLTVLNQMPLLVKSALETKKKISFHRDSFVKIKNRSTKLQHSWNADKWVEVRMNKSIRLRWAGHVTRMEEGRSAFKLIKDKPTGIIPLGRPRRRLEDNIRTRLEEIGINTQNLLIRLRMGNTDELL